MIEFYCSSQDCRQRLRVPDDLAGQKVECPKCETVMTAPGRGEGTSSSSPESIEATMVEEESVGVRECGSVGEEEAEAGVRGQGAGGGGQKSQVGGQGAGGSGAREELEKMLEAQGVGLISYETEEELAHGGMGAILLCQDKTLGRPVAMKVMRTKIADSEEHRMRFLEEAQVTGQLEHPNIVPIHELGKDSEGNLYFTMKLVKGKSLGQIIKEMKETEAGRSSGLQAGVSSAGPEDLSGLEARATMSLSELLGVFLKVCDGMAFAHSRGVIHRDLKPDNIMVGEFGEVLVMDWGLAKVLRTDLRPQTSDHRPEPESETEETDTVPDAHTPTLPHSHTSESVRSIRTDSDVALTVDGQISGTPHYMPPEQAEGKIGLLDHRTDIYSLGAILYELLTLERAIDGGSTNEVLLKVSESKIVPPGKRTPGRHIPKELSAVCMKALEKNRRKRYQSVQGLSQDIKRFLEGRSVSAKEDSFVESVGKLIRRNKGISAAIAAAALILLTMGAVFTWDNAKKRRVAEEALSVALEERRAAAKARQEQIRDASIASEELARQAERAARGGHWTEAEIGALAAQKLAPEGPWGPYAHGISAREKKELALAEKYFKTALAREPGHELSKAALSEVLAIGEKLDDAAALVGRSGGSRGWVALKAAGDALYKEERHREAEEAYSQALEQLKSTKGVPADDEDWQALLRQGDALMASEFYGAAKPSYEKALAAMTIAKNVPAGIQLRAKTELERSTKALDTAESELELARGSASAWIRCEGFYESIRDLPAKEQFARTKAKLEEVHGENVAGDPVIVDGVLRGVQLSSNVRYLQPLSGAPLHRLKCDQTKVRDLTPLKGMPLKEVNCQRTQVSDLSPLEGMPLRTLQCDMTGVRDLEPLRGMPLTELHCSTTQVSDLSPLQGMPLKEVNCHRTQVSDLSPLKGTALTYLNCSGTRVSDLSPLKGMPLTHLDLYCCRLVSDLTPLEGMPLRVLDCFSTQVSDLSPLKGMPLKSLEIRHTPVADLTPLRGMNLEEFSFFPQRISKGIEVLRQIKGIRSVNNMKPEEFWKRYDAGEFK